MSARLRLAIVFGLSALAAPSAADDATFGLGRALDRPSAQRPAPRTRAEPEPASRSEGWAGPQVQLGYAYYRLSDGWGGGDVHAGGVSVFLQLPVRELRLAAHAELGAHDYTLAGDDLVARGTLEVGVQLPDLLDPIVPHASALVSFGAVVGQRFETTIAHEFGGGGVALGASLRLHRNLHLGLEGAYLRLEMEGAAFDVFLLRIAVGL